MSPAFSKISDIINSDFEQAALKTFQIQAQQNPIYKRYLELIRTDVNSINEVNSIPFLPISFFKTHKVVVDGYEPKLKFTSSGTTGTTPSTHYVADIDMYIDSFMKGFQDQYGKLEDFIILGLLPSYMTQKDSSLVYMTNHLIKYGAHPESGFFLDDLKGLSDKLTQFNADKKIQVLLLGVTYALLDLAESFPQDLSNCIIMETGGMKGRRKEMTRIELHQILCEAFHTKNIHSEYGMTELLSQAWSKGKGIFKPSRTMQIKIRDINDPLSLTKAEVPGAVNIIDLANQYSCSFIATEDLGRVYEDGTFEILGRLDRSDIRGCNLLVAD